MALLHHGWAVVGMARDLARRPATADPLANATWITGDATNADDVSRAAKGVQAIVPAVNPPGYRNWDRLVLPMIDNSIAAAKATGARIVLPGTIYNYGDDAFPVLVEDSPQNPVTRKGRIRVELERRLEAGTREGTPALIVRFGDFFGPAPGSNWFSQGMVTPGTRLSNDHLPGAPWRGSRLGLSTGRRRDDCTSPRPRRRAGGFRSLSLRWSVGRGWDGDDAGDCRCRRSAPHEGQGASLGAAGAGRTVPGNTAGTLQDALSVGQTGPSRQRRAGRLPRGGTAYSTSRSSPQDASGAEGRVTQSHTDRVGRGEPKVTPIPGDRLASDSIRKCPIVDRPRSLE